MLGKGNSNADKKKAFSQTTSVPAKKSNDHQSDGIEEYQMVDSYGRLNPSLPYYKSDTSNKQIATSSTAIRQADSDPDFMLREPIGETGVVSLSQNILEIDDENSHTKKSRENLI